MKVSVIILSFNSSQSIRPTIERAAELSDDVLVVDSFSSDDTVAICESLGARVYRHAFESYGEQRNWAIDSLPIRHTWQLHLDADEQMDRTLIECIRQLPDNSPHSGFLVPRYLRFLGRKLRHGGMSPTWHLRLFRSGSGRCELRKYDQHFYIRGGSVGRVNGTLLDDVQMSLSEWTARHNRWSDAEVSELTQLHRNVKSIEPKLLGNRIQRKRFWRARYNSLPLFVRPFILFFYRYFIRLGLLDGRAGLVFWILQTFWFRFLVDAKIFELGRNLRAPSKHGLTSQATNN